VIYREIRGVLIKVANRIAAALHYILDEGVGTIHSSLRIIDKQRLLASPIVGVPRAFLGLCATQIETHAIDSGRAVASSDK
jgi:hypothetical protein